MKKINLVSHIAALMIVTVLCGLIYASVQQSHRSAADDPQLQIAEDVKNAIEKNQPVAKWMTDSIDISRSLSVFKTLYNRDGQALQSTGFLNGRMPSLPRGVWGFTSTHGEDVVTWQPQNGVRMAMVVEAVNSPQISFIAVGRSLKEVEKRESNLTTMVAIAWFVCVGIIILHVLLMFFSKKN